MLNKIKNKSAFTLVELSIVIAIIGLLVAATFSGISLLKSSETKALLSEVQKLNAALSGFQSMYKGMPGDMANATRYWSSTANGSGNGRIDAETGDEPFRAIQQLSLANLLEGAYAGFTNVWGTGFTLASNAVSGNVIGSKSRDAAALYIKCCSSTDYSRTLAFNNHVSVFSVFSDITKRGGILSPVEAYEIDKKIDDGVPDTGLVGASGSYDTTAVAYVSTGCYSSTGSTSVYLTADATYKNANGCQMQFAYDWD